MYIYTITSTNNGASFEVEGYNLLNGLKNANLVPTYVERLSNKYMANTPFDERERTISAFYNTNQFPNVRNFIVKQRRK
jgi:hypothetical protein